MFLEVLSTSFAASLVVSMADDAVSLVAAICE